MRTRRESEPKPTSQRWALALIIAIASAVPACGEKGNANGGDGSAGAAADGSGGVTSHGGTLSGGGVTALSGAGSAGSTGALSAGTSNGGASGKGGASASAGNFGTTGGGGTTSTSGGSESRGGAATGGSAASGGRETSSGGVANAGAANGGGGNASGCTRELLKSTIDAYFKALEAHDASTLPLSETVKFTENGKVTKIGTEGLWKTAGPLKYAHSALDTEACASVSQSVVPDGSMDIPVAVRLKLQGGELTEIETIAVRPGDYKVSGQNFASNTNALIASGQSVKWEDPVPPAQRNTREEIAGWMDKYYRMFPRGVCNTATSCKRIENGGGSFDCSAGASCDSAQPTGQPALDPRLILVDIETGLGVGFTMFMGNTDTHLFKMYGGKVYGVSAILGAATNSGWD